MMKIIITKNKKKDDLAQMLTFYKIPFNSHSIIMDFSRPDILEAELLTPQFFETEKKPYIIWYPDEIWNSYSLNEMAQTLNGYMFTNLDTIKGEKQIIHKSIEEKDYKFFNFTDLLGDKKFMNAYTQFQVLKDDYEIDEMMGVFMWWIRYMMLVKKDRGTDGLIGAFPEGKMKKSVIKWKQEELDYMYRELLSIYTEHDKIIKMYMFQKLLLSIQ